MGSSPALSPEFSAHSSQFVFYRTPQSSAVQALSGRWQNGFPDTASENMSFVLAPFEPDALPCHLMVSESRSYQVGSLAPPVHPLPSLEPGAWNTIQAGASEYQSLVQDAVTAIGAGPFSKLVASHTVSLPLALAPEMQLQLFHDLCQRYPAAFVYWLAHPGYGTWLAATPERLIQAEGGVISTDALAGTKPVAEVLAAEAVGQSAFTQKEIEEHAHVVHYITDAIGHLRIPANISQSAVTTKLAGPVAHLHASIDIEVEANTSDKVLEQLIALMHPTSATCGSPKTEAVAWLKAHEGYDRSLYAGYLGPIMGTEASLYVNLRCMKVHQDAIQLYVGAGITSGSVPEAEWKETLVKAQTLLAPFTA